MKKKLVCLSSFILSLSTLAFANVDSQVTQSISYTHRHPNIANNSIQGYEKNFSFDWNNYATIAPNKIKIKNTESFLATLTDTSGLSPQDQQRLGKLLYKLGTFYTHVSREPDLAITKMNQADTLLTSKQDKAWNINHLAYAYEQKYAMKHHEADKKRALTYTDQVISQMYPNNPNKEVAFAYCVKGLILNDAQDYPQAEANFKKALHIYETMPEGKDDQYARAKNRLADIILDQNDRDQEALVMLKDLKAYWLTKKNVVLDPYAARNFISLGRAYLKIDRPRVARNEFNYAIRIYKNVYGNRSILLTKPYQLLAESYKKSGNLKQAKAYEKKSIQLAKR